MNPGQERENKRGKNKHTVAKPSRIELHAPPTLVTLSYDILGDMTVGYFSPSNVIDISIKPHEKIFLLLNLLFLGCHYKEQKHH